MSWIKRVYHTIPYTLQALTWLLHYIIDRWPLRGVGLKEWQQSNGRVTFFSYLFNLVSDASKQGHYESRYWGSLPDALQSEACKTNWLHLYVKDALLPTSKQAADTIQTFNNNARGLQQHVTLDTFLSPMIVCRALRDWCRLLWLSIGLRNELRSEQDASVNLWPLFEEDWQKSFFGDVAINNLLYLNLFETALECLPQQQTGVYLQENQGWEFSLIYAWQELGHGRLIGTPHSTVRFWDLRYFFDPRSYQREGRSDLPMPDQVAINGPAVRDAYINSGYSVDDLVEVEALRYLHLCEYKTELDSSLSKATVRTKGAMRVLVLGEYLHSNTQQQMNLLEQAGPLLPLGTVFIVKPHPACPIRPADYPGISMSVTFEPIEKLLFECDVAYSSAVTSAAVDAYCAGVPIVSVLDPNTLNLSPLYGCKGVIYASKPEELVAALLSSVEASYTQNDRQVFFTLDPKLSRWLKLLLGSIKCN